MWVISQPRARSSQRPSHPLRRHGSRTSRGPGGQATAPVPASRATWPSPTICRGTRLHSPLPEAEAYLLPTSPPASSSPPAGRAGPSCHFPGWRLWAGYAASSPLGSVVPAAGQVVFFYGVDWPHHGDRSTINDNSNPATPPADAARLRRSPARSTALARYWECWRRVDLDFGSSPPCSFPVLAIPCRAGRHQLMGAAGAITVCLSLLLGTVSRRSSIAPAHTHVTGSPRRDRGAGVLASPELIIVFALGLRLAAVSAPAPRAASADSWTPPATCPAVG